MITKTSDHEVQTKNNIPKNHIAVLKQKVTLGKGLKEIKAASWKITQIKFHI